MQLDVKGAWDAMVERFVKSPATRKKILDNPFYKNLTEEYAGSEAYAALLRALACPVVPRLVIISLDPGHFANTDLFWERSVRFGFVRDGDVATLRAASLETGDYSVYAGRQADGVPALLRDALYRIRFPPLYFGSLVRGAGAMRWWRNRQSLDDTLAARGHYYFGTSAGSDAVALDGHLTEFRPLPILDHYFDRILALLATRGIEARFVEMPVNDATWREIRPEVRTAFFAYLAGYGRRYKLFHVDLDLMPQSDGAIAGVEIDGRAVVGDERRSRPRAPIDHQFRLNRGRIEQCRRDESRWHYAE